MAIEQIRALLAPLVRTELDLRDVLQIAAEFADGPERISRIAQQVWVQQVEIDRTPMKRLHEWAATVPDVPEMIVQELVMPHTLTLVSGRPKAGKSLFLMQLAVDVASGRPVFGEFETTRPGPVCYFALEEPSHILKWRAGRKGLLESDIVQDLYTFNPEHGTRQTIDERGGLEWIEAKVAGIEPRLIIIDTLREGWSRQWNDAREARDLISTLHAWAVGLPNDCAVILVAHNSKSQFAEGADRVSGSNELVAACDGTMVIDHTKQLGNGDICSKVDLEFRWPCRSKFRWVMSSETCAIRVMSKEEEREADREDASERNAEWAGRVVDALHQMPGHDGTVDEIAAHIGKAALYVQRWVSQAVRSKLIVRTGTRTTGGRTSAVYSLKPPDNEIQIRRPHKDEEL
jgi:RecA-family ATPase